MINEIVIRPRAGGKTTEIIRRMAEHPDESVCVCFSADAADNMWRDAQARYPELSWKRGQFVSAQSRHGTRGNSSIKYRYVDNADYILAQLAGGVPDMVTFSSPG